MKAGTYTFTEEMTAGMALQYNATKSKTVVVKAGQTASVTFVNTKYTGHMSVNKYSEDGKIEGVEFALCRYILDDNGNESMDSFYDTKFTDENGFVEWNDLPAYDKNGDEYFYWVVEDHIPPQYAKVQFYIGEYDEIKVDDGQSSALTFSVFDEDISLTAVNTLKRSKIEIYKKDVETGQVIPIAGTEFQIYDSNGEIVTLTDDKDNSITTFVTDKTGCAKLPEPLVYGEYTLVEVKAPEGYVIDKTPVKFAVTKDGATVIVEKKNSEQKGKINIVKTGNVFKSVESGEAETKELYLGDYKAVETAAPNGYVRDKSEYLVSLTYGGQVVSVTSYVIEAYNHYEKINVTASKFMEELSSAEIGLFMGDETEFSENSAILTDISDSDGSFRCNDIPFGVYQIKEIKSPEGYILTDKVFPVTISENGQDIELTIENEKIHGNVEVNKYDSDTDEKLSGAIFTLYRDGDSDGNYNSQNDVAYDTLNEVDGIYSIND